MKDILNKHSVVILRKALMEIKKNIKMDLEELKAITKIPKDKVIDLLIKHKYDISKLPTLKPQTPKANAKASARAEPKVNAKASASAKPKVKEPKAKEPKAKAIISEDIKLKRELKIFPLSYFYSIDDIINEYKKSFTKIGQKDRIINDINDLKNYQLIVNEKFTNKRKKSDLLNERLKKYLNYNQNRIDKANNFLKSIS